MHFLHVMLWGRVEPKSFFLVTASLMRNISGRTDGAAVVRAALPHRERTSYPILTKGVLKCAPLIEWMICFTISAA